MLTFSDYKGEEAWGLWADLLEPITEIMSDAALKELRKQEGVKVGQVAAALIKNHKKELSEILLRIDPTELDGLNILTRTIALLRDLSKSVDAKAFFDIAEDPIQTSSSESSGSATESIVASTI